MFHQVPSAITCVYMHEPQSFAINPTEASNSRLFVKTDSGRFIFFIPLWIVYYSPVKARYCPCCRASQLDHPHRGSHEGRSLGPITLPWNTHFKYIKQKTRPVLIEYQDISYSNIDVNV